MSSLPLEGIRVLELGHIVAGPTASSSGILTQATAQPPC
jgi:crotonobetainyl-CoA:carnitine CoA-transferase CaiB-like acyl-CoA transferase